jgi:predicted nucleic acid-binding Zn ribbon protein
MMPRRFARIGDILPAVLKSVGLEQRLREQEILKVWPTAVGADIAARTRAVKMEKGVLFVQVEHGAWLQELHFMEREIIEKLRERAPGIKCRKIRFSTR